MSDRNNIQLAIGYGLGIGMFLAGIAVILIHLTVSFFLSEISIFVVGGAVVVGGVAIAVYNAAKLDQEAVSTTEDASE
jgi:hypothetical protein